jgi:hypothetical protein
MVQQPETLSLSYFRAFALRILFKASQNPIRRNGVAVGCGP